MQEVIERKDQDPKYTWDLSDLYVSDEAWEEDLKAADVLIEKAAAHSGKLTDAAAVKEYLEDDFRLGRKLSNLGDYAFQRYCEDTRASAAQKMYLRFNAVGAKASAATSYGTPELLSLPGEKLDELVKSDELKEYTYLLEKLLRQKKHMLSAAEEKLLSSFSETFSASSNIADSLRDADLAFGSAADAQGNAHEVTNASFVFLESQPDRTLRENVFHTFYKGYSSHVNTFASAYAGTVKAKVTEARLRGYGSSREMSMSRNNIPVPVYDSLVDTVRKHLPSMYRYVSLRRRLLGVDDLHLYDIYAPLLSGEEKQYTYEEAQELILEALSVLGNDYTDQVRKGFEQRWIDVYPNKGKQSGAYSAGTYDSRPYILTNFTGSLDSVSTIAHELGHSMNSLLSNKTQPFHYAHYTLFVAEVASTVNECLLIENLLGREKDPKARLALLNQYLENFKGTVFRQTMFAEFEKKAHALCEQGEALVADTLNGIYRKLNEEYFGPELVIDDEVQYEWSRIPHFYNPFYVYVYATGYSAAVALADGILKEGEPAVKRYKEFLAMGGSADPLDELRHAGVNLSTPEPVDRALKKFAQVLDEAEKLADELGL